MNIQFRDKKGQFGGSFGAVLEQFCDKNINAYLNNIKELQFSLGVFQERSL
jgi:hypothetical protein